MTSPVMYLQYRSPSFTRLFESIMNLETTYAAIEPGERDMMFESAMEAVKISFRTMSHMTEEEYEQEKHNHILHYENSLGLTGYQPRELNIRDSPVEQRLDHAIQIQVKEERNLTNDFERANEGEYKQEDGPFIYSQEFEDMIREYEQDRDLECVF
ncbi:hypothetical protein P280DRAFT_512716 [Massarina eburnea CBS 473.64]|uniref:Uncharacterized protein n=1 Tax=Massarina eburnea CBS 473.64 TaxID=1395130 RepID=A0A6A6SHS4_9PLEO|nr:hypothetical protein P280DRAFT_512716 [Massarina eburnea CBS 473.64]